MTRRYERELKIRDAERRRRADQRHLGQTQDKELASMQARRGPARAVTHVGPISHPEPSAGVPESERR
jgi:hypothetical protein